MDERNPGEYLIHVFNSRLAGAKEFCEFHVVAGYEFESTNAFIKLNFVNTLITVVSTLRDLATFEEEIQRRNDLLLKASILHKYKYEIQEMKDDEFEFFLDIHNDKTSTDIFGNIQTALSREFLANP